MTHIKICGIKNEVDALVAARAGADYIGLVFATSTRRVTPAQAAGITTALKENKAKAKAVGIFVNTPPLTVRRIAEECSLDLVQFSGDEDIEYCLAFSLPVIKAFRIQNEASVKTTLQQIDGIKDKSKLTIMLDAAAPGKYGGTGKTFDLNLARPITKKYPVIIAGGLNPENVSQVIKTLKPWGVDVSSGVETKGVKDMSKVIKFITAVREANASQA
jgi:phosphoribosylanthranilate isomerase